VKDAKRKKDYEKLEKTGLGLGGGKKKTRMRGRGREDCCASGLTCRAFPEEIKEKKTPFITHWGVLGNGTETLKAGSTEEAKPKL